MDDLETFEDFRTISLHNTIYKIITKVERNSMGGNSKRSIWFSKWKENSQHPQNHTKGSSSCQSEEKTCIHSQIGSLQGLRQGNNPLSHINFVSRRVSSCNINQIESCITIVSFAILINGASTCLSLQESVGKVSHFPYLIYYHQFTLGIENQQKSISHPSY